jgi:hypothetical protein
MIGNTVLERGHLVCRKTTRKIRIKTIQDKYRLEARLCIHHRSECMIGEALPAQVLVYLIALQVPDRLTHFPCTLLPFGLD